MTHWPDVVLTLGIITAMVVLQLLSAPEDASTRSLVLGLLAILGPWIASARNGKKIDEVRAEVQTIKEERRG